MHLSKYEKRILIGLICEEQSKQIIKNPEVYQSDEYKKLEELKVKIKGEKKLKRSDTDEQLIKCNSLRKMKGESIWNTENLKQN